MGKRAFEVTVVGWATIEIDDEVIDAVDDEWRSVFYDIRSAEQVAEHIGYNMLVNNATLSQIDGWADMDDDMVGFIEMPDWIVNDVEDVTEDV